MDELLEQFIHPSPELLLTDATIEGTGTVSQTPQVRRFKAIAFDKLLLTAQTRGISLYFQVHLPQPTGLTGQEL